MLDLAIAAAITSLEFSSFEIHKVIRSCTDAYLDIGHPLGGVIDLTKPSKYKTKQDEAFIYMYPFSTTSFQ